MRYENTKTGAIIDSPYIIKGDLWVPIGDTNELSNMSASELRALVTDLQAKITEIENKTVNDVSDEDEIEDEEEIDLQTLTNKQLEELAKEHDILLTTEDKKNKDTRIAAIVKALG